MGKKIVIKLIINWSCRHIKEEVTVIMFLRVPSMQ